MSSVHFELNLSGLNALMKSPEMCAVLNRAAASIASAAGQGFEVEPAHPIRFVGIASVYAATGEARRECSDNDTLSKAAGGARV